MLVKMLLLPLNKTMLVGWRGCTDTVTCRSNMLALNIAKGNIAKENIARGIAEIWANIIMRLEKHFRKYVL